MPEDLLNGGGAGGSSSLEDNAAETVPKQVSSMLLSISNLVWEPWLMN